MQLIHGILVGVKQSSLALNLGTKKTRKQDLLAQMDRVVFWAALVELIAPYYPEGKNGRPPFALETTLRIHCCMYGPDAFCKPLSFNDQRSAHMYSACLMGAAFACPQP
jgi:hypothetical protein